MLRPCRSDVRLYYLFRILLARPWVGVFLVSYQLSCLCGRCVVKWTWMYTGGATASHLR